MTQTERIQEMERLLDQASEALTAFDEALEEFHRVQDNMQVLDAYYGSQEWLQDFDDDAAGKLPADLKRGVLSEDTLYDLLTDNKDMFVRLLEMATEYLRKS